MFYPKSYQLYRYEHGLGAGEQRAADDRAGEARAALRDLRLWLGRLSRPGHRVPSVGQVAGIRPCQLRWYTRPVVRDESASV
jgi:hypothetical protein